MAKYQSRGLLVAVSDELAEIRIRLEELADLTAELLAECPADRRAQAMSDIQAFDLLIQRLDGLSGLAAALGAGTSVATALHALTLSDLYDRLVGEPAVRSTVSAPSSSGDLTLFD